MEKALLFMRIVDPEGRVIAGDAQTAGFEDQIRLSGWDWGLTPAGEDGGGRRADALLEPSVLTVRKSTDRATPALLGHLAKGSVLRAATVRLEDRSDIARWSLTLELGGVRIKAFDVDVRSGEKSGEAEEKWQLDFATIQLQYRPSVAGEGAGGVTGTLEARLRRSSDAPDTPVGDAVDKLVEQIERLGLGTPAELGLDKGFVELRRRLRAREPLSVTKP